MQPYVIYKFFKDENDDTIIARLELYDRDLTSEEINNIMDLLDAEYFE